MQQKIIRKKSEIDKLNEADAMVFQTEKQIKEYGDKITEEDKNSLSELLDKLKTSIKEKNIDVIDSQLEDITTRWQEISQKMYQSTQQEPPKTEKEENVTDVEYEEV